MATTRMVSYFCACVLLCVCHPARMLMFLLILRCLPGTSETLCSEPSWSLDGPEINSSKLYNITYILEIDCSLKMTCGDGCLLGVSSRHPTKAGAAHCSMKAGQVAKRSIKDYEEIDQHRHECSWYLKSIWASSFPFRLFKKF